MNALLPRWCAWAGLLLGAWAPALAQDSAIRTGRDVARSCGFVDAPSALTMQETLQSLGCTGYVLGVADGLVLASTRAGWVSVCIRTGTSSQAVVGAVVQWLRANEGRQDEPSVGLVDEALRTMFPCR